MAMSRTLIAQRYRLVRPLGRGGMGTVWLAHDEALDRDVAVKEIVIPAALTEAEGDQARRRSLREARTAARLNHLNVIRMYDIVESDSRQWIVMEYVPSRSLHDVISQDGPLPPERVARIGLGVLAALQAAHRAGVLHRDVKPSNVLLTADGRVVLSDFGLAVVAGSDTTVTRPGMILGSPAYISPERAREGISGPASDLWSLGATLYAAVEGHSPYERSTPIATLTALATEEPDPATRAGPLRPVLRGLLRKDPEARISAAEAHRMLLKAANPAPSPLRRLFQRTRRPTRIPRAPCQARYRGWPTHRPCRLDRPRRQRGRCRQRRKNRQRRKSGSRSPGCPPPSSWPPWRSFPATRRLRRHRGRRARRRRRAGARRRSRRQRPRRQPPQRSQATTLPRLSARPPCPLAGGSTTTRPGSRSRCLPETGGCRARARSCTSAKRPRGGSSASTSRPTPGGTRSPTGPRRRPPGCGTATGPTTSASRSSRWTTSSQPPTGSSPMPAGAAVSTSSTAGSSPPRTRHMRSTGRHRSRRGWPTYPTSGSSPRRSSRSRIDAARGCRPMLDSTLVRHPSPVAYCSGWR